MLDKQQATLLKQFITVIKQKPEIIHQPDLAFFKEWLLSLGAKLPEQTSKPTTRKDEEDIEELGDNDDMPDIEDIPNEPEGGKKEESESEEEIESDVELEELDNLIKDEEDIEVKYPQESFEVTEEMRDESNVKRCEAMAALGDGNLASALSLFTEAVMKNPTSANLYAKRASVLIKMKKPKAAIKDCDKALSFNKDCAQPYKWRGRAHRLLGNYEEAYHDFQMSCHLDMDETVYEWQKEVEKNAKNIMEHRRKYERINEERKRKEAQKRREEYERAKMEEAERKSFPGGGFPGGMPGGFPGGMPGGSAGGFPGGMPGGAQGGMPDLNDLLRDPELLSAMQDPEVMAAFQDVSQNPANMAKYENNLKIKKVMEKLQKKFGGAAAPPGGM